MKIVLSKPFEGEYPVSFGFGEVPTISDVVERYAVWGLVGHNGIDFALPVGTPIVAAASGNISRILTTGDYGNAIMIDHDSFQTLYAHLQEISVTVGQSVDVGEKIGLSGKSGFAFEPHLHFGLLPKDADHENGYLGYVDPSIYMKMENGEWKMDGEIEEKEPKVPEEPKVLEEPEILKVDEVVEKTDEKEDTKDVSIEQSAQDVPVEVAKEVPSPVETVPTMMPTESTNEQTTSDLRERLRQSLSKGRETSSKKKQESIAKVYEYIKSKGPVSGREIRTDLNLSKTSVIRFTNILEGEGKIREVGEKTKVKYEALSEKITHDDSLLTKLGKWFS